jgi:hypothetical protein
MCLISPVPNTYRPIRVMTTNRVNVGELRDTVSRTTRQSSLSADGPRLEVWHFDGDAAVDRLHKDDSLKCAGTRRSSWVHAHRRARRRTRGRVRCLVVGLDGLDEALWAGDPGQPPVAGEQRCL